jgi:thioesterase domain-containing protein
MIEQPLRRAILRAVIELDNLRAELQSTWLREIPLATAIGIEVAACGVGGITSRAPLEPNSNVHGTAFAGSLFSVCVLTGWGALWVALRHAGRTGRIVVSGSRIRYRKPVGGEIVCRCAPAEVTVRAALDQLHSTGRAKLSLTCTIDSEEQLAVTFEGTYVVLAKP